MKILKWLSVLPLLWMLIPMPGWAAESATPAADIASKRCLICHTAVARGGIAHRAHGLGSDPNSRLPAVGCVSCHGLSEKHAGNPGIPPVVTFPPDEDKVTEANAMCQNCHGDGATAHWNFGPHSGAGVACVNCHSIHSATDPVQERAGQFEVCTRCHLNRKTDQTKFSRHPMVEGHVQCTDCHAPHGSNALSSLVAPTVNDTCYQCHADKRGPFLFEHEPVQDDCTHCHLPHASVNEHLLKARPPMLCQQCHIASRHPGTLYDSQRLEQREIFIAGQACTNCHSQVHGGNQPASSTFRR